MARLGAIQRDVVAFLSRCDPSVGAYIGSGCKAEELRGYDLEQVERALSSLVRRGFARRAGIRYILCKENL